MDQPTTQGTDIDAFLGVEPPSRNRRLIKWGAIAGAVLILLFIAWKLFGGSGGEVSYATEEVRRGDLTVTVSATGNLAPTNEVDVGSELSGTVVQVLVDNNDRVTKGQLLARLDPLRLEDTLRQSRAALASAQASVAQAQATLTQSQATLRRFEEVARLSGGKVPSKTELDTARADVARGVAGVRTAQAQVAQAAAQLSSDQTQLSKASIVSPVNGVVLSRQIEPGQTVAASLNAPVLFQLAEDLSAMRLEVKVDEADVGQVNAGQRATFQVDAFPGRTFPATIERVDLGANASGNTTSTSSSSTATATNTVVSYTARLTVSNPDLLLRPGMTATADIVTTEKRGVLLVPNAALRWSPERAERQARSAGGGGIASAITPRPRRGGGGGGGAQADRSATIGRGSQQTVYVLGEDGKPKAVQVTVGDTNGSQTEVSGAGITAGTQVITGQLAPGQTQQPRERKGGGGDQAAPAGNSSAAEVSAPKPAGGAPAAGKEPDIAPVQGPPGASGAPQGPSAGEQGERGRRDRRAGADGR